MPKTGFVKPLPSTERSARKSKTQPRKSSVTRRKFTLDTDNNNGSTTPAKRCRRLTSIFVDKSELSALNSDSSNTHTFNDKSNDDDSTTMPDNTAPNYKDQFDLLRNGPLCFKGKVRSNSKALYKNDTAKFKSLCGNTSDTYND